MYPMQAGGLALATSISAYCNLILLSILLKKKLPKLSMDGLLPSLMATSLSSIGAAAAAIAVNHFLGGNIYICVPLSIFSAMAVFIIIAKLLKSKELEVCAGIILRRKH
jgi:peptidoglycan biosynthesis protein MviN/MurJ (putative lipid II flippase)